VALADAFVFYRGPTTTNKRAANAALMAAGAAM
jgi:hypothetical protein